MQRLALSLAIGFALACAPVHAQDDSAAPKGEFEAPPANWLFVQNAGSMSYDGKTLTLENAAPQTAMFTDRPQRMTGVMPTKLFVDDWSAGKDSFEKDPPNAALSVVVGGEEQISTVELSNPKVSGTSLSYDVKVLDGTVPQSGKATTLFLDWWYGPRGGICNYGPWGGTHCHFDPRGAWN